MRKPVNTAKEHDDFAFLASSMVIGSSNTIERQEAQGQQSFVESDTLPTDGGDKQALEAFGFKFLGPVEGDPLFQYVEMPKGWKKVPSDHSMWSYIHDEQGRERIAVFYKAAFYDRSAHYSVNKRFGVRRDYGRKDASVAQVLDGGKVIFSTGPRKYFPGEARETWMKNYALDDEAKKEAADWLATQYPEWESVAAYW